MSVTISMGMGVGGSFILILGGRIIQNYGYRTFFLTAASLSFVGGLLFLGYFRNPRGEFVQRPAHKPAD
jgi:MFS family permease